MGQPWTPEKRAAQAAAVAARQARRIEDIEFLLAWDHNAESVARRAGFTCAASAQRALNRWGRNDLASKLHRYAENVDVYSHSRTSGAA